MGVRPPAAALAAALVVLVFAGTIVTARPAGADDTEVTYRPPVEAPVVDAFRAPTTPFGAGNRGLTYDLSPATSVRASAPGEVVFAGAVAGTLHVTVLHADGLRTTYSFLQSIEVRRGQAVDAGDRVGTGGPGFHFGVRDGDAYLDPAALFGAVEVRVRLVPHEEPLPPTDAGLLRERIALREVVRERSLLERMAGAVIDLGGEALELGSESIEQLRAGLHLLYEIDRSGMVRDAVMRLARRITGECSADDAAEGARPGDGHVALLVGGYGSSSRSAAVDGVDTGALGYADSDVLRYSYAGGRVPHEVAPDLAAVPARAYEPTHTFADLRAEGRQLADTVEAVARARPGAPIDLIAHSQGGLVARLAVLELERRGSLDSVGGLVTLGTPHRGTDLATAAVLADGKDHQDVQWLAERAGLEIDTDAESVLQMAETSSLVRDLAASGVPDDLRFRSVAATGDLVVPADKSEVDGHETAMVGAYGPGAHDDLPGRADTTTEIALGLSGRPPSCRGVLESLGDAVVPEVITFAENGATVTFVL